MGDWIHTNHWFVCEDACEALRTYERLEFMAQLMDNGPRVTGSATGLRFGFASPRLIIAMTTQKWGEDASFGQAVVRGLPGVVDLSTESGEPTRSFERLEPEFAFAWCADPEIMNALKATLGEARVGATSVIPLGATALQVLGERGVPPLPVPLRTVLDKPHEAREITFGLYSRLHGLVGLGDWNLQAGEWEGSFSALSNPLHAARLGGPGAWAVINELDYRKVLPSPQLGGEAQRRMERHGPLALWQGPQELRSWVSTALASPEAQERQAAAAMIRRWGLLDFSDTLVRLLGDASPHVRAAAAFALYKLRIHTPQALDILGRSLFDLDDASPQAALVPALESQLQGNDPPSLIGLVALGMWGGPGDERDALASLDTPLLAPAARWAGLRLAPPEAWGKLLSGCGELPGIAARIADLLARPEGAPVLSTFADRCACLAHALRRATYWMVERGAPEADIPPSILDYRRASPGAPSSPPLALQELLPEWDGRLENRAGRIVFWCGVALRSLSHADPIRAAVCTFAAFDAAVEAARDNPAWRLPPVGWIDAHLRLALGEHPVPPLLPAPEFTQDPALAQEAFRLLDEAESCVATEPQRAYALFMEASALAARGHFRSIALRGRYRALNVIYARLLASPNEAEKQAWGEQFLEEAQTALALIPAPTVIWHFSEEGALDEAATRWLGNNIAWELMGRGELARALTFVDLALIFARNEDDWIRDTKANILLRLGRTHEAYNLVRDALRQRPHSEALQTLATSAGYQDWLRSQSP